MIGNEEGDVIREKRDEGGKGEADVRTERVGMSMAEGREGRIV